MVQLGIAGLTLQQQLGEAIAAQQERGVILYVCACQSLWGDKNLTIHHGLLVTVTRFISFWFVDPQDVDYAQPCDLVKMHEEIPWVPAFVGHTVNHKQNGTDVGAVLQPDLTCDFDAWRDFVAYNIMEIRRSSFPFVFWYRWVRWCGNLYKHIATELEAPNVGAHLRRSEPGPAPL